MAEHSGKEEFFVTRDVVTYTGDALVSEKKDLVVEESYQLYVNGRGAGEMICSPWGKKEAFLGYLFLKGYISSAGDVRAIDMDEEHGIANITIREYLTEEPGEDTLLQAEEELFHDQAFPSERKRDDVRLSVEEVLAFSRELEERSALFHRTGGVHCAAFARNGQFLSYKEDISRHVAVDKVVGDCLIRKIPMSHGILIFSGRVPVEILQKVGAMGCSVLIAKSAPTNYSCRLAQELGITLIGFARDKTFNIYSHPERIFSGNEPFIG